jgi:hypothetical protein
MWKKLTQVFVVDDVRPCVEFWTKRFGFETTIDVPEGDRPGYVALRKDEVELHYRSRSSLVADLEALAQYSLVDTSVITIEMTSLVEVMGKLDDVEVIIPRRRSFYGHNEVVIRAPGGQIVIFTAPGNEPTIMVQRPSNPA